MIHLLRASHANEFELQNYAPLARQFDIRVITSQRPLTQVSLPTIPLWSPTDLPTFPFRRQILNRTIGGEQWLIGLEKVMSNYYHDSNHGSIMHTAETYTPYTHQAVQLRKRGVIKKLICTCWETIPHNNEKFARLRQWKQGAYQYVDCFHTPTKRAKKALVTEGVDPKRIVVIPYGVDLRRFTPAPHALSRRPLVLTVARLELEKGMKDLEMVAASLPRYQFLVIGEGSYPPHGDNITVSSVAYSQIHYVYQRADLFFFPSRTTPTWEEQYGMALVEAMACGLPIVTTGSGAIPEVVGDGAITCPVSDVSGMANSLHTVLSDLTKYRLLSQRSRAHAVKHYDIRRIAKQLAKLYI